MSLDLDALLQGTGSQETRPRPTLLWLFKEVGGIVITSPRMFSLAADLCPGLCARGSCSSRTGIRQLVTWRLILLQCGPRVIRRLVIRGPLFGVASLEVQAINLKRVSACSPTRQFSSRLGCWYLPAGLPISLS